MKAKNRAALYSIYCSMIMCTVLILSVHDRFARKPACFLNSLFNGSTILFRMILLKTLLTIDSRAIPLQLLHSVMLPFFGILTITASFHSSRSLSETQISLKSGYSMSAMPSASAFKQSPGMLFMPAVFPILSVFRVFVIFVSLGGSVHILLVDRLSRFPEGRSWLFWVTTLRFSQNVLAII